MKVSNEKMKLISFLNKPQMARPISKTDNLP